MNKFILLILAMIVLTLLLESCSNLWTNESKQWFEDKMDAGLFIAYFYYPPKTSHNSPHYLDRGALVCDLFTHLPDNGVKLWKFSYERPPLEHHMAFLLVTKKFAAHCGYFESELNRKKSQRELKAALSKESGIYIFVIMCSKLFSHIRSSGCFCLVFVTVIFTTK